METFDKDQTTVQAPRFCPECGTPAGNANFRPGCGHNMGFTSANTVADKNLRPPPGDGPRPRGRAGFVIAGGVLAIAAIAVAVIVLLNHHSSSGSTANANPTNPATAYEHQLNKLLTPLVAANQQVSNSLGGLHGSRQATTAAKAHTTAAISALGSVRGGLTVLNAPTSTHTLSGQVQQALSADSGYLDAVSETLDSPTGPGADQLQTLATGAQTAMVNLNPIVSGASASITNTSNLVSWAQGAKRHAAQGAKNAQRKAAQKAAHANQTSPNTSPPPAQSNPNPPAQSNLPAAPSSGMSACDQNIYVDSSTTTCGFADSVFQAYAAQLQAGGSSSATVTASSATTGQTYQDYCSYDSSSGMVSCTHGTDEIQFPQWAAADY